MTAIQYRMLVELSANAGRMLTYEHKLRRVWGLEGDADVRPMPTAINAIRRKLDNDTDNSTQEATEKLQRSFEQPLPDQ